MSSPRSRLFSRVLAFASVLWLIAFALVCSRVVLLSRRIRSTEARLSLCEASVHAMEPCICRASGEFLHSDEIGVSSNIRGDFVEDVPSFSVLGTGRLSSWVYVDVRFDDGEVLRYYTRIADGTEGASNTLARIRSDSFLHRAFLE